MDVLERMNIPAGRWLSQTGTLPVSWRNMSLSIQQRQADGHAIARPRSENIRYPTEETKAKSNNRGSSTCIG
jgi:hypothetical protein